MGDVLIAISQKGFGVAGVVKESVLVGVITDGDLRRHMQGLLDRTAAEVMTKNPKTTSPEILAEEALAIMYDRKITTLFVSENSAVTGILHIHDCLRAGLG